MSIQAKLSQGDPRLYDPNRDIAHNFKFVVQRVAGMLEDRHWPALNAFLAQADISMDDLGEACRAYAVYVATTAQHPHETIEQAMARSGWDKVPDEAKIAHQAYVGLVLTGMWYYAARDASLGGDTSVDAKTLVDEGERVARRMSRPAWWRRLRRWLQKAGRGRLVQ